MPTLKYKLRSGKDYSSILLDFNYGTNRRLRYSTGLKVKSPDNWNEKTQRVKNVVIESDKLIINNRLNEIKTFLESLYLKLSIDDKSKITNQILKNELNIFLKRKIKVPKQEDHFLELLPFYDWYINNYKINPLPTTKRPLAEGTIKTYKNAFNILKNFNDKVYNLSYGKITLGFYDDFLGFLNDRNLSANYIGTQIKILKTIMNASFEKNFHSNTDFTKRYFAKPQEEVSNIYLTEQELLKIYHIDLANFTPIKINKNLLLNRSKLENARDLFLIGANTGLRISDYNKLTSKNIINVNGSDYIIILTTKTGARLTIPINPMVDAILKKRDGTPPPRMPEQHLNYSLKLIGKIAGFDNEELKTITKGGKKVIQKIKKFKLISSHTARRSFCTNAYKSGMPTIDIMAISGHKTEKVFYNYIKVNDIERAEKIKKHKFFTNNNL